MELGVTVPIVEFGDDLGCQIRKQAMVRQASTSTFPFEMLASSPFIKRFLSDDNLSVNKTPSIWSYSC